MGPRFRWKKKSPDFHYLNIPYLKRLLKVSWSKWFASNMIGKFGTNFLINLYSSSSSTSVQSNGGLSSMEQGILNFFNLVLQIIFYEIDVCITYIFQPNQNLTNDCHQFCSSSCLKFFLKTTWRKKCLDQAT